MYIINKVKRQFTEWEKVLPNEKYDNGLISRIYNYTSTTKKIKQLNSKIDKRLKQNFSREDT